MKKLILSTIFLFSANASAFTDSFWFEPSLLCAAGAAGGYSSATKGNEGNNAAIGCALGGLIGYMMNSHYESKFAKDSHKQIEDLKKTINEIQAAEAQKTLKGLKEDESIAIRVRTIVPGYKNPDGSVVAPTYKEELIRPSDGVYPGE